MLKGSLLAGSKNYIYAVSSLLTSQKEMDRLDAIKTPKVRSYCCVYDNNT